jgi:hypothetical protein
VPWLRQRPQPPASVMRQLDADERVVSFADVDGGVVVATPRGLWWPFPGGMRRIGWERVDKAVWTEGWLTVTEADLIDDLLLVDRPPISARVVTPRDLPPTVRKRVESSVVRSEVYPVPGGAARFVGRRIPGRDGVTWWVRLERGTRDTEATRNVITDRINRLQDAYSV